MKGCYRPVDSTDSAAIYGAVKAQLNCFVGIGVLINNAGRFYTGFFETMYPEQVRNQMEVSCFDTLNVTRAEETATTFLYASRHSVYRNTEAHS